MFLQYSYEHADCWNAPSWPYETARVMTSAANVMNDYPAQTVMDTEKYLELIVQYVALASSLLSFFKKYSLTHTSLLC